MKNTDLRGSPETDNIHVEIHVDLANFLPGTFVLTTHYLTATFALIWPLQTTEIEEIKNGCLCLGIALGGGDHVIGSRDNVD